MVQAVIPASSTHTHFELHWYQMEYISFVKSRGCLIKQAVQRVQRFLKHGKSADDMDQQGTSNRKAVQIRRSLSHSI